MRKATSVEMTVLSACVSADVHSQSRASYAHSSDRWAGCSRVGDVDEQIPVLVVEPEHGRREVQPQHVVLDGGYGGDEARVGGDEGRVGGAGVGCAEPRA